VRLGELGLGCDRLGVVSGRVCMVDEACWYVVMEACGVVAHII
jgi:hypothetical protein